VWWRLFLCWQVSSFVKIYGEVEHGWAVRYDTEDAEAVKAAEEAHKDLLDWLAKHLKWECCSDTIMPCTSSTHIPKICQHSLFRFLLFLCFFFIIVDSSITGVEQREKTQQDLKNSYQTYVMLFEKNKFKSQNSCLFRSLISEWYKILQWKYDTENDFKNVK